MLNIIHQSEFLTKLYPNGLTQLAIHKVDFINNQYGNSTLYLYTNQKPAMEIKKYGVFGLDYNCIVIEVSCEIIKFAVENAGDNKTYSSFEIGCNQQGEYELKQHWDNGYMHIVIPRKAVFQKITVYKE